MNNLQKVALAEFVVECALGVERGDLAGTAPLYAEMAKEAEEDDVFLPLVVTISRISQGESDEMSNRELAAWMKGWAWQFDPRTAT